MAVRILFVTVKYALIFAFVLWLWEWWPSDEQAYFFWALWVFSAVYGSVLFFRSQSYEHS